MRRRSRPCLRWTRIAVDLAVAGVGVWLVIRSGSGLGHAWLTAHHLPPDTFAALGVAVVVAVVAHLAPVSATLPELDVRRAFLFAQSNFALSNLVPAGSAVSAGVTWTMLRRWGVSGSRATAALSLLGLIGTGVGILLIVLAAGALGTANHLSSGALQTMIVAVVLAIGVLASGVSLVAVERLFLGSFVLLSRVLRWRHSSLEGRVTQATALAWRHETIGLARSCAAKVAVAFTMIFAAQFAVLLIPLAALQAQRGAPPVSMIEVLAVFALARFVAIVPVSPGGLGTVDAAMIVGLGWIGVSAEVAVPAVLIWRLFSLLPQATIGLIGLAFWQASLGRSARVADTEESRTRRWLHRSFFSALAAVTWIPRARRFVFERIHRGGDPWQYEASAYEVTKATALALLTVGHPIGSIVEAGCANGHLAARLLDLHPSARLLAIDVSPTAVAAAQYRLRNYAGRIDVACSDISTLQIDRSIDLVVMSEVLYYLGGPAQLTTALQGWRSSIAVGGMAILAHPPADASNLHGPALAAMGMERVGEVCVGGAQRPVIVTLGRRPQIADS